MVQWNGAITFFRPFPSDPSSTHRGSQSCGRYESVDCSTGMEWGEWNTGTTLIVLAISFLKQFWGVCNGSESFRV